MAKMQSVFGLETEDLKRMPGRNQTTVPVVLVDGHNLLYRAAHGFPVRIQKPGGPDRTALFGFFALLRKAATKHLPGPAELIICFDGQRGSERRVAEYNEYKANRSPDEGWPIQSLPQVKDGLDHLGIPWIEIEEFEADDVIATLVQGLNSRLAYIMSTDKDFVQLVNRSVLILNTAMQGERQILKVDDITSRFHVSPSQWCDYRALTGDPADNIPGIRGIGRQKAAQLLADGAVLESLEPLGRLNGKIGAAIKAQWGQLLRDRDLIRLRTVPHLPQLITGRPFSSWVAPGKILEVLNLW